MENGITTMIGQSKNGTQHQQLVFHKHIVHNNNNSQCKKEQCVDSNNYFQTSFGTLTENKNNVEWNTTFIPTITIMSKP